MPGEWIDEEEIVREPYGAPAPPPALGLCVCGEANAVWYRADGLDDNYCDACFELAVPVA